MKNNFCIKNGFAHGSRHFMRGRGSQSYKCICTHATHLAAHQKINVSVTFFFKISFTLPPSFLTYSLFHPFIFPFSLSEFLCVPLHLLGMFYLFSSLSVFLVVVYHACWLLFSHFKKWIMLPPTLRQGKSLLEKLPLIPLGKMIEIFGKLVP